MTLFDPYVPDDFQAFWDEAVHEAASVPLRFLRTRVESPGDEFSPSHRIDRIEFDGADGQPLEGWIATHDAARRLPSFLWIPPYGRESLLPNAYGTREGMTSMSLNLHGHDAFHQEKYTPSRGYFAEGVEEPETWVFRRLAIHCMVALRVLQAQPEADEDRIGAMGMSQGAGLAIWSAVLSPIVRAVAADMPFLCAMRATLNAPIHRYPLKELPDFYEELPLGKERVLNTLSYFDTVNMASRCAKPVQVSLGLKDPAARPDHVRACYEALRGPKQLIEYDWGHDWHPEMIANNRQWLLARLG